MANQPRRCSIFNVQYYCSCLVSCLKLSVCHVSPSWDSGLPSAPSWSSAEYYNWAQDSPGVQDPNPPGTRIRQGITSCLELGPGTVPYPIWTLSWASEWGMGQPQGLKHSCPLPDTWNHWAPVVMQFRSVEYYIPSKCSASIIHTSYGKCMILAREAWNSSDSNHAMILMSARDTSQKQEPWCSRSFVRTSTGIDKNLPVFQNISQSLAWEQ